ncbi:universal stress protein [Ureibacillus sp. 179-F W5.1 NHS]|uniref:Universal stress protein n=1 Tax=Lysinibacillus halotolerans TaxID=1368476 RepID=A0A3M8H9G3_9BACI|nr:universal stress protein [Lysinibacillus halotolerans]RNC98979.1 universal stress protein [Lysinibacillus halotolerans]
MYKQILLAADGSENAVRATKEAIKIASFHKDSIIDVVYVVDFEKTKVEVLHSSSSEALNLERRKKLSKIEHLLRESNISYKVIILHGTPGLEIVKYANEQQVDLVVIGSRGLNSLQEMVLGSVSHKVMKRVNCPALIVK